MPYLGSAERNEQAIPMITEFFNAMFTRTALVANHDVVLPVRPRRWASEPEIPDSAVMMGFRPLSLLGEQAVTYCRPSIGRKRLSS